MKIGPRFILYSTVLGVFSSAAVLKVGIGIQAFYLLILFNLFVMALMKRLWLPRGLIALLLFLLFNGSVGILRGTDTPARFFKEFVGIAVSGLYFCSVFRAANFKLAHCFRLYARVAYWVALLGLVLFPIRWVFFADYRLRSVFAEPAAFASVCLPAAYYFADQWQRHRRCGRQAVILLLALACAQSSTGFIGLAFGLCIFFMRFRRGRILLPAVIALSGVALYTVSSDFALRLDDSLFSFRENDVTGTNLSTYALFSNLFVMENVIQQHPILGNGLGSHGMSYARYIGALPGVEEFTDSGFEGLNAEDASSLTIRLLSDTGILGVAFVGTFLWFYRPRLDSELSTVSKAITVYFFVLLLRGGLYFGDEEFFFIILYALCGMNLRRNAWLHSRASKAGRRRRAAQNSVPSTLEPSPGLLRGST